MKKIITTICLVFVVVGLSSCSKVKEWRDNWDNEPVDVSREVSIDDYDHYWEREKLTSNLHINGKRAKHLLDRDLAECLSIANNRKQLEEQTVNTKKCDTPGGGDWEQKEHKAFIRKCMKDKGWIPSNCCAFEKDCICD